MFVGYFGRHKGPHVLMSALQLLEDRKLLDRFEVDFYGFDEGDLWAEVIFEAHPPTGHGLLLADQVFILDRGRVAVAGTVAELTRGGQSLEDVFLAHTSLPAGA